MAAKRQLSLGGGLISKEFWGRVDQVRHQTGLAILRNWHPIKSGAIQNRTGTTYQATVYDPRYTVREWPWVFNVDQTYKLEFSPQRCAFWVDGEPILEAAKTITAATKASPCQLTSTTHGYSVGEKIYLSGLGGMTELNGRYYIVRTVPTANTFTLSYCGDGTAYGTAVDSTAFTTYTTGGTAERVYSITTPYIEADLPDLKFAQSADTLIITHGDYATRSLTRTGNTSWTLAVLGNGPSTAYPTGVSASGTAGTATVRYMVTALDEATGIESLSGTSHTKTVTGITKASEGVVTTSTAHNYATGDEVVFTTVSGMTELSNRRFKISVPLAFVPDSPITITSITQASPMVVTKNSHGLSDGDQITFSVTGMTELNDLTYGTVTSAAANTFQVYYYGTTTKVDSTGFQAFTAGTVTRVSANATSSTTFTLVGEDTTSYGTFSSGSVYLSHYNATLVTAPAAGTPITVTTNATATAGIRYTVYKELGGVFGFIGSTYGLTFVDDGITPDTLSSTPIYREPFHGAGNYPSCCAFYQQRLVLGGSDNSPNGAEASVIGDYTNFTIHSPHEDSDAVHFQTAGYVDAIRDMVPLDKLVCLTSGAEFVVAGGGEGAALTPTETNVRPRTYNGTSGLFPLLVDSNVLYLDRGRAIRDFHYSFQSDNYIGLNRSLFVPDLFSGHTIVDWAYQRNPNSVLWAVREDGTVLSMTYQPDQEMFAWAEHEFENGLAENVCVVPEGSGEDSEDAVYFVIARTLEDDSTTRYVERLSPRTFTDVADAKFVDSCISFDGTGTGTVTLSGSGWTNATALTATFSVAQSWSASTVGDDIQVNSGGVQIRCRVTGYTSSTVLTVIPHTTVPVAMRSVAISDWAYAPDTFSGLWHLEGQTVSILGDGYVAASALNPTYEATYTVTNGAITLTGDQRYSKVHIGMPIKADAQTLPINPPEDGRFMASTKLVNMVAVSVADTRGLWAGAQQPTDDDEDPIEFLYAFKVRDAETYEEPTALKTGALKVRTKSRWDRNGQVFLRMLEPLPATVLNVSASGSLYNG